MTLMSDGDGTSAALDELEAAAASYEVLFAQAPIGFALFDTELRFLRVNQAMASINGMGIDAHIGRTLPEALPAAAQAGEQVAAVIETGTPRRLEIWGPQDGSAPPDFYECAYHPVFAPSGDLIAVCATVLETTGTRLAELERESLLRAAERTRAEAEASAWENEQLRALATRLNLADDAIQAADAVVEAITRLLPAIEAGVYLVTEESPGRLRRVGHAGATSEHDDPKAYADLELDAGMPVTEAVASGREMWLQAEADWEPFAPALRDAVRRSGSPVVGVLPLTTQRQALGVVYANFPIADPPTPGVRRFLTAVAAMSAPVFDRLGLLRAERRSRSELQALLLALQGALVPANADAPRAGGASLYRPGDARMMLGGDFFDVVALEGDDLAVLVGDVSGHGARSAGVATQIRAGWRALIEASAPQEDVLPTLDRVVAAIEDEQLFATVLCCWIRRSSLSVHLAVAGHPPPFLVSTAGAVTALAPPVGPPIGLRLAERWPLTEIPVTAGSQLLFFTDGVYEGRRAPGSVERLGLDAFAALVQAQPRPLNQATLRRLLAHAEQGNGGGLDDDVALLAITV